MMTSRAPNPSDPECEDDYRRLKPIYSKLSSIARSKGTLQRLRHLILHEIHSHHQVISRLASRITVLVSQNLNGWTYKDEGEWELEIPGHGNVADV